MQWSCHSQPFSSVCSSRRSGSRRAVGRFAEHSFLLTAAVNSVVSRPLKPADAPAYEYQWCRVLKIVTTLVLLLFIILALFFLMMGALGTSFGIRVGGNLFAEEGFGLLRLAYLILIILAAGYALQLLWRVRGRVR